MEKNNLLLLNKYALAWFQQHRNQMQHKNKKILEIQSNASYLRQIIIVKLLLNWMCCMANRRWKHGGDTQLQSN